MHPDCRPGQALSLLVYPLRRVLGIPQSVTTTPWESWNIVQAGQLAADRLACACKISASGRTSSNCHAGIDATATVLPPPTVTLSPPASEKQARDDTHSDPSTGRSRQRFAVAPTRRRGQEIACGNAFLEAQCIRQVSLCSLRAYAVDLLHFARWWEGDQPLSETTESTLLGYVHHQLI